MIIDEPGTLPYVVTSLLAYCENARRLGPLFITNAELNKYYDEVYNNNGLSRQQFVGACIYAASYRGYIFTEGRASIDKKQQRGYNFDYMPDLTPETITPPSSDFSF